MSTSRYVFWVLLLVVAVATYDMIHHTLEKRQNAEVEQSECRLKDFALTCTTTYKEEE